MNLKERHGHGVSRMEKIGYVFLAIVAVAWLVAMLVGMIAAFPVGLIGLLGIVGFGFLFAKVVADRIGNQEDDHYSRNVDK